MSDKHPKCLGTDSRSPSEDDDGFYCGYETLIDCGECKYGCGLKNPEAKCNQPTGSVCGKDGVVVDRIRQKR